MRLIVLLIFVLGPSSEAAITLEEAPRLGHETWLTITRDEAPTGGETVTVVHRPGIVGEEEIAIGITDARGRVRWTPRIGGLCTLHAGDQQTSSNVKRALPPAAALTLLGLIIMTGFGAVLYGIRRRQR